LRPGFEHASSGSAVGIDAWVRRLNTSVTMAVKHMPDQVAT
jgi:hypothetical protein